MPPHFKGPLQGWSMSQTPAMHARSMSSGSTQGQPMSPTWNNSLLLRLHAWMIHESNTSNAWAIPECNPEKLHVFKAPRFGWTSWVDELDGQVVWTSGLAEWFGKVVWMSGLDEWFGRVVWTSGFDEWFGRVVWTSCLDEWFGRLVWTCGLDKSFGRVVWTSGLNN